MVYAREDGWTLVAQSHTWDDGFRNIEMKGKELRITKIQSIETGEMELDYQGNILHIPVEKLMFDNRDLFSSSKY